MTKLLIVSTSIIVFSFTSSGQIKTENRKENVSTNNIQIDSSIFAIMNPDSLKSTHLSREDLIKIERILLNFTKNYNPDQEKQFKEEKIKNPDSNTDINNFIIDLRLYKRQYFATTNEKGEIEVWINCFCETFDKNWRKELIIADDGGNCFFNLKINLTTEKYYDLIVNGYG